MLYFHSKGVLDVSVQVHLVSLCLLLVWVRATSNTVRRKVFIDIYIRCVVYFSPLDALLNNNCCPPVLFLGKFIKEHTSLEGLVLFSPKLLHGE